MSGADDPNSHPLPLSALSLEAMPVLHGDAKAGSDPDSDAASAGSAPVTMTISVTATTDTGASAAAGGGGIATTAAATGTDSTSVSPFTTPDVATRTLANTGAAAAAGSGGAAMPNLLRAPTLLVDDPTAAGGVTSPTSGGVSIPLSPTSAAMSGGLHLRISRNYSPRLITMIRVPGPNEKPPAGAASDRPYSWDDFLRTCSTTLQTAVNFAYSRDGLEITDLASLRSLPDKSVVVCAEFQNRTAAGASTHHRLVGGAHDGKGSLRSPAQQAAAAAATATATAATAAAAAATAATAAATATAAAATVSTNTTPVGGSSDPAGVPPSPRSMGLGLSKRPGALNSTGRIGSLPSALPGNAIAAAAAAALAAEPAARPNPQRHASGVPLSYDSNESASASDSDGTPISTPPTKHKSLNVDASATTTTTTRAPPPTAAATTTAATTAAATTTPAATAVAPTTTAASLPPKAPTAATATSGSAPLVTATSPIGGTAKPGSAFQFGVTPPSPSSKLLSDVLGNVPGGDSSSAPAAAGAAAAVSPSKGGKSPARFVFAASTTSTQNAGATEDAPPSSGPPPLFRVLSKDHTEPLQAMNIQVTPATDPVARAAEIARLAASVQPAALAAARSSLTQQIQLAAAGGGASPRPISPILVSFGAGADGSQVSPRSAAGTPASPLAVAGTSPRGLPPLSPLGPIASAAAATAADRSVTPLVAETVPNMTIPPTRPASASTPHDNRTPSPITVISTQFAGVSVSPRGAASPTGGSGAAARPASGSIGGGAAAGGAASGVTSYTSASVGEMSSTQVAAILGRTPSMSMSRGGGTLGRHQPKRPANVVTRPPSMSVIGRAMSGLTVQQPQPGQPGYNAAAASYMGQTIDIVELPVQPLTPLSPHSPPDTPYSNKPGPKKLGTRFSDRRDRLGFGSPISTGSSGGGDASPLPALSLGSDAEARRNSEKQKLNRLSAALHAANASNDRAAAAAAAANAPSSGGSSGRESPTTPDGTPARSTQIHEHPSSRGTGSYVTTGSGEKIPEPETPDEIRHQRAREIVARRFGRDARERKKAEPIPYAEVLSTANGGQPVTAAATGGVELSTIVVPSMPRLTRPPSVKTGSSGSTASSVAASTAGSTSGSSGRSSLTVPGNAASMKSSRPAGSGKRTGSEISLQIDEDSRLPPPTKPLQPLDMITGKATTPRNSTVTSPRAAAEAEARARVAAAAGKLPASGVPKATEQHSATSASSPHSAPPISPNTPSVSSTTAPLLGHASGDASPSLHSLSSGGTDPKQILISIGSGANSSAATGTTASSGDGASSIDTKHQSTSHAHLHAPKGITVQIPPGGTGGAAGGSGGATTAAGDGGDGFGDIPEGRTPESSKMGEPKPAPATNVVKVEYNRCGCTEGPDGLCSERCSWHMLAFIFICVVDVAAMVLLYIMINGPEGVAWWDMLDRDQVFNFTTQTVDLCILLVARLVALIGCALMAVRVGRAPPIEDKQVAAATSASLENEATKTLREAKKLRDQTRFRKHFWTSIPFVVCTFSQMLVGVKIVSFDFVVSTWGDRNAIVMFCVGLVAINAQAFLIRNLIQIWTKETGKLRVSIHPHVLTFKPNLVDYKCNLCMQDITAAYNCKQCDFDCCVNCFNRKADHAEGLIRTDRGVVRQPDLTVTVYLGRTWELMRPHKDLLIISFICILASATASLVLPYYQGQITDGIIRNDLDTFYFEVKLFLGVSIGLSAFGAVQGVALSLVGARMRTNLRSKVFDSIMVQDTAFFDGINTGELIARLSSDADASIGPIQGLLGAPTDFILAGGGLIMCFYTAPRLAILSLTGIGPIILVMRIYARWSKRLNKAIREAFAASSSSATQSIENLRTVRAFNSEPFERRRYRKMQQIALDRTTKEVVVGVGTSILTDVIDLGATVFLLWYGGLLVIHGHMTLGELITFELYWGLVKASYSDLVSSLTAVTRAVGAAGRVFTILDCQPDIEPTEVITDADVARMKRPIDAAFNQSKSDNEVEDNGFGPAISAPSTPTVTSMMAPPTPLMSPTANAVRVAANVNHERKLAALKDAHQTQQSSSMLVSLNSPSGGVSPPPSGGVDVPANPFALDTINSVTGAAGKSATSAVTGATTAIVPASPASPGVSDRLLPAVSPSNGTTAAAGTTAAGAPGTPATTGTSAASPSVALQPTVAPYWSKAPAVSFEGVHFAYQQRADHHVLSGLDLTIPAGTVCALVGASGGGKTTIVNLLLRYYDPDDGQIMVDGQDLRDIPVRAMRAGIGLVSQDTQLFSASIEENICYGLDKNQYTEADLIEAAKLANAHHFIMQFPEKYKTRVGERGVRLSGGQKQRIAIARALVRKPKLLLLDEATSALDAESEAQVQASIDLLLGISKRATDALLESTDSVTGERKMISKPASGKLTQAGCTVLLVAHRLSTVVNAHQIAVVGDGGIKEKGTHHQLMRVGGAYARLVRRQMARRRESIDE